MTLLALGPVLANFPEPPGKQISIGPLNLRAYGLMIAFGVIAAVWLFGRLLESERIGTRDDAGAMAMWGVTSGIVGARLYHVITDWSRFSDNLSAIPKIWEGGLGVPGGLAAGIAGGLWQAHRRGLPIGVVASLAAPAIPLAQAIGRWGNWFNQELFGRPTDLPWALEVDPALVPTQYPATTTFHPTFLYESLWNFALCAVLLLIHRRFRLGPGRLMACYLVGYGIGRFWIEGLRIDPAHAGGGLRLNQWVALAAIASGVIWLLLTRGRMWPDSVAVVPGADTPESDGSFGELLDEVGGPAGHPGDRERGDVDRELGHVNERPESEVDVGELADPSPGLGEHGVDLDHPAAGGTPADLGD